MGGGEGVGGEGEFGEEGGEGVTVVGVGCFKGIGRGGEVGAAELAVGEAPFDGEEGPVYFFEGWRG